MHVGAFTPQALVHAFQLDTKLSAAGGGVQAQDILYSQVRLVDFETHPNQLRLSPDIPLRLVPFVEENHRHGVHKQSAAQAGTVSADELLSAVSAQIQLGFGR